MTRFTSKGNADPWRTHKPYRPTKDVLPAPQPRKDTWLRRLVRAISREE